MIHSVPSHSRRRRVHLLDNLERGNVVYPGDTDMHTSLQSVQSAPGFLPTLIRFRKDVKVRLCSVLRLVLCSLTAAYTLKKHDQF